MSNLLTWFQRSGAPFLAGVVSLVLMLATYRIGWWPIDDTIFAYLGERVLNGAVLGVDVYDFHGGYHSYLNALLFKIFGVDMVVLRYPFIVIAPLQTMLVAHLLRHQGFWVAFWGGLSMTSLTFILFPNPSPNWFVLFFAIVSVYIVTEWDWRPSTLLTLGFVWGLSFMFRHPSATFLLLGIVAYAVYRQRSISLNSEVGSYTLHHSVILISLGVVLAYTSVVYEWLGFFLFGLPPIALSFLLFRLRYDNFKQLLVDGLWAMVGAAAAIAPMVVFQLFHGDVLIWLETAFLTGMKMANMEFFHSLTYVDWFLENLAESPSFPLSFLYVWYFLSPSLVPLLLLGYIMFAVRRNVSTTVPPAVIISTYYGLVSFYFQIEFYFFVGFPLLLVAVLLAFKTKELPARLIIVFCLINLQLIAVFQLAPSVANIRFADEYQTSSLPRTSLEVPVIFHERYEPALKLIEKYTEPNDVIYPFPFNPEFYYLSGRQNAFPSMGSTFDIESEEEYQMLLEELQQVKPAMMIMATDNFYFSEYDWRLLAEIQSDPNYQLVGNENYIFYFARMPLNETPQSDREDS